ncbi:MAG: FtsX-like permease family protein [Candidatus Nanopelagicales bacterium]
MFLLTFAFIALFVAVFLIFNTFSMLVAQRTRELALLRAVGYQPRPGTPVRARGGRGAPGSSPRGSASSAASSCRSACAP